MADTFPTLAEVKSYCGVEGDDKRLEIAHKSVEYIQKENFKDLNAELIEAFYKLVYFKYTKPVGVSEIKDIDVTMKYNQDMPLEVATVFEKYAKDDSEVQAETRRTKAVTI